MKCLLHVIDVNSVGRLIQNRVIALDTYVGASLRARFILKEKVNLKIII